MEPHWISVLQKIEAIEAEIKSQGYVRNYSIYTDQSDDESGDESANEVISLSTSNQNQLNPVVQTGTRYILFARHREVTCSEIIIENL